MIFHIDGNTFYASCERLFRPDLYGKPIAVLSNNDGIIIALNQECKDLGFKRGDVYFKARPSIEKNNVTVCSSNYTLYADISARLNVLYNRYAPDVEVYSIDESFLYFPDWKNADYSAIGRTVREAAGTEIGVPVSVGIAPSKTLAKLCNKLAKKQGGVCEWARMDQEQTLRNYPVGDVWGIGPAKTKLLNNHGVTTAWDLKNYPLDKAKKYLSIVGLRTVQELNGIPAIDRCFREKRDQIMCSRSFSAGVFNLDELMAALADYTQEAVKRLREDGLACSFITVFLMTNPWGEGEQYANQATARLDKPTSYLPAIMGEANRLLRSVFRHGYKYRKTMILLSGITEEKREHPDLFEDTTGKEKRESLMKCFDALNDRYGRGTIRLGVSGLGSLPADADCAPWVMKREFLSPEYTTRLCDVPKVW
jgi:DNA polymerase V